MADKDRIGFLSDNTRKIRKGLLIVCLVGFSISKVGLIVRKISFMGSELAITNFESISFILGIMVLYYLLTFICYGFDEYSYAYRKLREKYLEKIESGRAYSPHEIDKSLKYAESEYARLETQLEQNEYEEQREKIRDKLDAKKRETDKLARLIEFQRYYRGSSFERFRFRHLRTFMELLAPIAIGIYTLILLFFFTPIPQLAEDIVKHDKEPATQNMQIDTEKEKPTLLNETNNKETSQIK
ncbi:MAG: hypothetical protein K8R37_00605 [Bacteroidales bacterium]|nr:hypothetical protein [Bacteroidales bacterium]